MQMFMQVLIVWKKTAFILYFFVYMLF